MGICGLSGILWDEPLPPRVPRTNVQQSEQPSFGNLAQHDVFLNHRGPDVKRTFVSQLDAALRRVYHYPFLDAKSLVKGRHAFHSIDDALSGVRVYVAVFSPRYAESKYCLNELCDMLASHKPIIPVFYNVEPENLRWTEKGPFAKAFCVHMKKGRNQDVVRWKKAMLEAGAIIGLKLTDYESDTKLVEKVVASVLNALPNPPPKPAVRHPMGLEESSAHVINMVHEMGDNVGVVGMCAMGGIGDLAQYDVFLNYRRPDVQRTFVSQLDDALRRVYLDPFFAAKSRMEGRHAFDSIGDALSGVRVHVAVLSPRYAESKYCLNELCDMLASHKPIIPVFYNVEPENLRWTEKGPFAKAFCVHMKKGRNQDVVRWKAAVLEVAAITGLTLTNYESDTKLVEKVVASVLNALPTPPVEPAVRHPVSLEESSAHVINMLHEMGDNIGIVGMCATGGIGDLAEYDVFLNHRGLDVKRTFVSQLEDALRRVHHDPFSDGKLLVKGRHAFHSIDDALNGVRVYVVVFSPRYVESKYCLNELCDMLASRKPIIPVFYDVEPENLRWTEKGPFAKAFCVHMKKGRNQDVVRWKAALLEVAAITGLTLTDYEG